MSQIGSGALPVEALPSAAIALSPILDGKRGIGSALKRLAADMRGLAVPIIGRIEDDRMLLDLRCLEDEEEFLKQISDLARRTS